MKKIIILFAFFISLHLEVAAQEGIAFSESTWSEIMAEATKENKLIFVDAYATWCGPCKRMSKSVFTKPEVGAFFNAQFINVKMDMEKGDGPKLARKYQVMAYPTLLFLDGKGEVVHRSLGYHNSDQLIDLGSAAIDPTRQLAALDDMYARGERSGDFLFQYAYARYLVADGSHLKIAEEYLNTQTNWQTEDNLTMIYRFIEDADSKIFEYFVRNKPIFIERFGERAVTGKIQNLVNASVFQQGTDPVKNAEAIFPKVYPEKAEEMVSNFKMSYYRSENQPQKFAETAIAHYKAFEANGWEELNEVAWSFYELVDNKKQLKQAVKWAKQSVEMEDNFFNNDTLAALYYKLKKKKKAMMVAEKAIQQAKASGDDPSETESLLEKIKML